MAWSEIFNEVTIGAGETLDSVVIGLLDMHNVHAFQYSITGDGEVDITVYTSVNGKNFVTNGVKANNVGKTSGPGSDGNDLVPLRLKPGDLIRFRAEEVGTSDSVVLSMWFTQK